ncbi:MAG: multicomponent Na+:H+ antiporter subunit E [Candidatus Azotimanducaceae bacterium]|jgi:multicomponent Na+:H+ antiporter subunit E
MKLTRHTASLSLVLAVFWLVLSGHYTAFLISLGTLSVVLVVWVCARMDVVDHESQPLHLDRGIFTYWLWLLKEVVLSSLAVTACAFRGRKSIQPGCFEFKVSSKSDIGKVIFANSVTLTPGTIVIDLKGDRATVHALVMPAIDGVTSIDNRVSGVE